MIFSKMRSFRRECDFRIFPALLLLFTINCSAENIPSKHTQERIISGMNHESFRVEAKQGVTPVFPQPQYNFQMSIPQAAGVAGLGLLLLKEISVGFGTWAFIPIFIVPLILLAITVIFVPSNATTYFNNLFSFFTP